MKPPAVLPAFAGYGIELEYVIVDKATLDPVPIADRFLDALSARSSQSRNVGMGWCHELALHVVEIRNVLPSPVLGQLVTAFQCAIGGADALLAEFNACLLPSAMHPWMDPRRETVLWSRTDADIYDTYDRIFDCRQHGWANIQSMHINLPFANDAEFTRLHAAVRLTLPLIPALAASSPIAEGRRAAHLDHRLAVYSKNSKSHPLITGEVIPDTVCTRSQYEEAVLQPMFNAIAIDDPAGVLRFEWLNSRGAIARFDRNAIEIRLADTQECPQADLAVAGAVVYMVRALYDGNWSSLAAQQRLSTPRLSKLLNATIRHAEDAVIDDPDYLKLLGVEPGPRRAADVWRSVLKAASRNRDSDEGLDTAEFILTRGTLASRINRALRGNFARERLRETYSRLCDCLRYGRLFGVGDTLTLRHASMVLG